MNKNLIICMLVVVIISLVAYSLQKQPQPVDGRIIELERKNDALINEIIKKDSIIKGHKSRVDTLYKVRTKTILKYEIIYKNIDTLSADGLCGEFSDVFAKEGIN